MKFAAALLVALFTFVGLPSQALACGASASSGGVAVCDIAAEREKQRKKFHVGAGYGFTSTRIRFSADSLSETSVFDQTRQVASASLEWRISPRWSVQAVGGGLFGSTLNFHEGDPSVGAFESDLSGGVFGLGFSWLAVKPKGAVPFLQLTGLFSGVFASDEQSVNYSAYDLRVGVNVGWQVARIFLPYATARVFGGPISYELDGIDVSGTDAYHYQLGLGATVILASRLDLYVEGIPLGERGVSAGIGVAF